MILPMMNNCYIIKKMHVGKSESKPKINERIFESGKIMGEDYCQRQIILKDLGNLK